MTYYDKSRSVRFQDDIEAAKHSTAAAAATTCKSDNPVCKLKHGADGAAKPHLSSSRRVCPERPSRTLKQKVLCRVFSEDFIVSERLERRILDPRGPAIHRWNQVFLVACLVSLFVDPLFFYLPGTRAEGCIYIALPLETALTTLRTLADVFYMLQIVVRFRTAYVAPSSRVFGRGELVIDPSKISSRYFSTYFWFDLVAALPLPQFLIWGVIPSLKGSTTTDTKNVLRFIIIVQYIPRLFLIVPLSSQIVEATGVITKTAWAGAAYNLLLYMLASHVLGASWYLLSTERQEACWRAACDAQGAASCQYGYFDCNNAKQPRNQVWFGSSNLTGLCSSGSGFYQFGIYADAIDSNVTSLPFMQKYFYCFWWGLRNLSSLGQNLSTSTYVGEISFAIVIAVLGLVLFGLLIGNMQSYLQSTTTRLEEWRIRRTDAEQWMRHRQLPQELRQSVRRYDQYKWVATRGVDEEALLKGLPMDLRRDIKRHLCLDLVRRVPLFDQMDEQMLDAICDRLKPALYTPGTCLVRELDPVNEMLFVIRGHLDSHTTNGGRTGFFNSCRVGPGDFCGEELLTWALDPRPTSVSLPYSTRTVKAISEVEAFALVADDLKFVSSQFRRQLHSKQLRHKLRFYSPQWRTWAACFIQAAWRRQKRRRASIELKLLTEEEEEERGTAAAAAAAEIMRSRAAPAPGSGAGVFVARLVSSARTRDWTSKEMRATATPSSDAGGVVPSALQKPAELDFSVDEDEDD